MQPASQGKSVIVDGRIVWTVGDLFKGKIKTDMNTRQPVIDQKTGEKVIEYGFGLAIPKSALSQPAPDGNPNIWVAMHQEAMSMFPSAQQIPPSFAMKYKDGDGVDDKGVPFAQREGYAGHIVVSCTTRLPIKFFRFENGANQLIPDGIKCGDYVRVQLTIKAHPGHGQGKAGLYVNPGAVQFLGYGKEIINTPSGDQIFGTSAPPVMGSATPVAPPAFPGAAPMAPAAPTMPQQPVMPASYQQPPQTAAAPHYGVVPQQFQPPVGGMPMAPAAPAPQQGPMWGNAAAPAMPGPVAQTPGPGAQPTAYPSNPAMPGMPGVPGYSQS